MSGKRRCCDCLSNKNAFHEMTWGKGERRSMTKNAKSEHTLVGYAIHAKLNGIQKGFMNIQKGGVGTMRREKTREKVKGRRLRPVPNKFLTCQNNLGASPSNNNKYSTRGGTERVSRVKNTDERWLQQACGKYPRKKINGLGGRVRIPAWGQQGNIKEDANKKRN